MRRFTVLICLLVITLLLVGCQQPTFSEWTNTGTTCANITMGNGMFTFDGRYIYFADYKAIYEYDIESGRVTTLKLNTTLSPKDLFCESENVFYISDSLRYVSKDGKKQGVYFSREAGMTQFYANGTDMYYINGIGGNLYHYSLTSQKETELIKYVNAYFVDNERIYVVAKEGEKWVLKTAERGRTNFDVIPMNFEPIAVYVTDGIAYLAQKGDYQIIQYQDNTEYQLPIYGTYYQVLDNKIIYSDSIDYANSCFPVKSYDLQTGEQILLCENVFDFCILAERFLCCECITGEVTQYMLIDLQNGGIVQMYPEEK